VESSFGIEEGRESESEVVVKDMVQVRAELNSMIYVQGERPITMAVDLHKYYFRYIVRVFGLYICIFHVTSLYL